MDAAHELAVLVKMADELKEYLLSEVLYWQMQAGSNFPRLSLGRLLLARRRLQALGKRLTPTQRAQWEQAEAKIDEVLGQWRVASEKRAEDELRSRLNLWSNFWRECAEAPAACRDHYGQEVTQRTIADLLQSEFPRTAASDEAQALRALDSTVRPKLSYDGFVWEAELQPAFPEQPFWYLYGRPPGQRAQAR